MSYPEDTGPADIDAIEKLPDDDDPADTGLVDPGVDRHDFATEWAALWEEAHDDPRETLPELEDLVARLLVRHGYVLDEDDPAAAGEEREMLASYASARDVADTARTGQDVDAGDVAQAIADLREVYESLVERVEGGAR